jgi:uncharacterized protein
MSARAAEVNGQGDAEAKITTQIEAAGDDVSRVRMETDLQMRGRVAQFGRGAMEKISQRMFDEFARNLEREMSGGGGAGDADDEVESGAGEREDRAEGEDEARGEGAGERASEPAPPTREQAEPRTPAPAKATAKADDSGAPLDAMGLFVTPALKRALPVVGSALVGLGYGYLLGRLRELRR